MNRSEAVSISLTLSRKAKAPGAASVMLTSEPMNNVKNGVSPANSAGAST